MAHVQSVWKSISLGDGPIMGGSLFLASLGQSFEDQGIARALYAYGLAAIAYGRQAKEAGSALLLVSRNGGAPRPG